MAGPFSFEGKDDQRGGLDEAARVLAAWKKDEPLKAGTGKPKGSSGGNQYSVCNVDNVNKSERLKGGNDTGYTLRRLARDHKDILAKFYEAMKEQGRRTDLLGCDSQRSETAKGTGNKAYTCERLPRYRQGQ